MARKTNPQKRHLWAAELGTMPKPGDQVIVQLPSAMALRLTDYSITQQSNAPVCLRQLIEKCGWSYSDEEIAAWRMYMLETETAVALAREPVRYFINGKAGMLLKQLSEQLKLTPDDAAALIFADICDGAINQINVATPATIIPFPSK